jgi:hypothetical protein
MAPQKQSAASSALPLSLLALLLFTSTFTLIPICNALPAPASSGTKVPATWQTEERSVDVLYPQLEDQPGKDEHVASFC